MDPSYIPLTEGVTLGDHTADIWLEVTGSSLQECIERSLHGLYSIMAQEFEIRSSMDSSETFDAGALEILMVDVLSEALFLFDSESSIILSPLIGTSDHGEGGGFILNFKRANCSIPTGKGGMEVKAATFHGAELKEENGTWKGRVLLDI